MNRTIKVFLLLIFYQSFFCLLFASEPPLISLHVKNVPLETLLKEIEKQSGFTFTYESSLLKKSSPVSLHVENVSIEKCLEQLFNNSPVTFTIQGKFIILKTKKHSISVSGFIRDKRTLGTLSGATVVEQRSRQGIVSNENGSFTLPVKGENTSLEISYTGYKKFRQNFQG